MNKTIARVATFLAALVSGPLAFAADDLNTANLQANACSICRGSQKHVLDGHAFLPSFSIPFSFADSSSTVALGFGLGEFPDPADVTEQQLSLGAFSPRVSGSVSLLPPLALVFGVSGTIITGMNSGSVLRYGGSVAYSLKLGAIFEVMRRSDQVLSVALEVDRPRRLSFSPREAAREGIKDLLGRGDAEYISDLVELTWRPSLRYALALSPVFGLQGIGEVRLTTSKEGVDSTATRSRLSLGLGFDADLDPWINIPVGFVANYLRGQSLSGGASSSDIFSFGIFETITSTVNVGLEIGHTSTGDLDSTLGAVIVRASYN